MIAKLRTNRVRRTYLGGSRIDAFCRTASDACVYLGFKPGVTREKWAAAIRGNWASPAGGCAADARTDGSRRSPGRLTEYLNRIPVRPGDLVFVEGGMPHAIGADVVSNRFKDDLVKTLTANPPNVAIDPVGGPLMGKCIATMPYRGRWISLASMAGPETVLDVNLLWRKNLRVIALCSDEQAVHAGADAPTSAL